MKWRVWMDLGWNMSLCLGRHLQCPSVFIWVFISLCGFCFSPSLSYKKSHTGQIDGRDSTKLLSAGFMSLTWHTGPSRIVPGSSASTCVWLTSDIPWSHPRHLLLRRPLLGRSSLSKQRGGVLFFYVGLEDTSGQVRSQEGVSAASQVIQLLRV